MNKVNPNEAPEGYVAVDVKLDSDDSCQGCAFEFDFGDCVRAVCCYYNRIDGHDVIFIKKE